MPVTRLSFLGCLFVFLGTTVLATGCNPNSIGRFCVDATNTAVTGPKIASPALECPSRLCLIEPTASGETAPRTTCTAECSDNSDCEAETKEFCQSGFACAIATDVGSFCCKKLCICRDDLTTGFNATTDTPAKIVVPYGCDPTVNSNVTCANVKQ